MWLDLCAGTGAVGIEALSRGAGRVFFVESSRRAASLIRENLGSLRVDAGFEVLEEHVARALPKLEAREIKADFIFLDPPYRMEKIYGQALHLLSHSSLLNRATLLVTEHDKQFDPGDQFAPLHRYRQLKQGESILSFYRVSN